jgi:hypothetical protein
MSFKRVAASYETASGSGIGSAAEGSLAVRIYQTFCSPTDFMERSITFLPIDSEKSY